MLWLIDPDGVVVASASNGFWTFPVTLRTLDKTRDVNGQVRPWWLEFATANLELVESICVAAEQIAYGRIDHPGSIWGGLRSQTDEHTSEAREFEDGDDRTIPELLYRHVTPEVECLDSLYLNGYIDKLAPLSLQVQFVSAVDGGVTRQFPLCCTRAVGG
jgi:hypothetical protein